MKDVQDKDLKYYEFSKNLEIFANVPFHYCMNRKGKSSSDPLSGPVGFLQAHASAFHLLSPSILEKLSYLACFFKHKLINFNLSEPANSFFAIILPMFFLISLTINFLHFGDSQSMLIVWRISVCMLFAFLAELKSYKYYFLDV